MTDRFEYKCIHIAHKTFLKPRCQGGWSPRCPRTLSTAPPVPGGGRQVKAPAVQRLSLMGNTQPRDGGGMWPWAKGQRDRDGTWPWASQRRCCSSSDQTRGAAGRGAGCLGGRGDCPLKHRLGCLPGKLLHWPPAGIMGKNQPAPPLICIFTSGEGHHGFGEGLGTPGCLSLILCTPQTDRPAVLPVLPSCL